MISKEQYLQFKEKFPLDSILASQARDQAYESFLKMGLPTKKDEAWKYTSLTYLKDVVVDLSVTDNLLSHEDMKWMSDQLDSAFINVVYVNGVLNNTLSDDIDDLVQLQDVTADDFSSTRAPTEVKMTALSQACAFQKTSVNIDAQVDGSKIIQFTFFQNAAKSILINPILKISIAENIKTRIIFNYVSRDHAKVGHVLNADIHIQLAPSSKLEFLQIQNENLLDTHVSRLKFDVSENAHLTTLDLALGGHLSRHYLEVNFNGEHADAGVYGVVAIANKQHSDHYTFINHIKGHNNSIQKYKSILTDQSHSVFRGRVRIEQDAQKANSSQLNNSLMLSREANVNSIPQLEIYADDVKAGHGSTVGQLSKDEMFYFLSRGIDQIKATQMLAYGFVLEMTSVFEDEKMKNLIQQALNTKLNGMLK